MAEYRLYELDRWQTISARAFTCGMGRHTLRRSGLRKSASDWLPISSPEATPDTIGRPARVTRATREVGIRHDNLSLAPHVMSRVL
jgi:hypothetical protein